MSRGFFSTFGAGTTDKITTNYAKVFNTQFSISAWLYYHGVGGTSLGCVLIKSGATGADLGIVAAGTLRFSQPFSTSSGTWTVVIPSNSLFHVLISYDASLVSNNPVVYINGVSVSVSTTAVPSGTFNPSATQMLIGNRSDNAHAWDGMISHIAVYNTALSAADAITLASGVSPLLVGGNKLDLYMPLDGINNPEFDYANAPSSAIVGTLLGASEPPVQPLSKLKLIYNVLSNFNSPPVSHRAHGFGG